MISQRMDSVVFRREGPVRPAMRKIAAFTELSGDEAAMFNLLHATRRSVPRGRDIVMEGEDSHVAFILDSGWACRYKLLPDGRRQILTFVLPGDFVGVHYNLSNVAGDSFAALTDTVICPFSNDVLPNIRRRHPSLSAAIDWALIRDQALLSERLLSIGRRTAAESLAHLLLELHTRLSLVGLAEQDRFGFPVTQDTVADALGLTVVHVNRTLRSLRLAGLATVKRQIAILEDRAGLIELAGFDPTNILGSTRAPCCPPSPERQSAPSQPAFRTQAPKAA